MPGRALKDTSDQHEKHADPHGATSSQAVTDIKTRQRPDQGSKFKSSNDDALNVGVVHFGKDRSERALGDNTALSVSVKLLGWKWKVEAVLTMTDMS